MTEDGPQDTLRHGQMAEDEKEQPTIPPQGKAATQTDFNQQFTPKGFTPKGSQSPACGRKSEIRSTKSSAGCPAKGSTRELTAETSGMGAILKNKANPLKKHAGRVRQKESQTGDSCNNCPIASSNSLLSKGFMNVCTTPTCVA